MLLFCFFAILKIYFLLVSFFLCLIFVFLLFLRICLFLLVLLPHFIFVFLFYPPFIAYRDPFFPCLFSVLAFYLCLPFPNQNTASGAEVSQPFTSIVRCFAWQVVIEVREGILFWWNCVLCESFSILSGWRHESHRNIKCLEGLHLLFHTGTPICNVWSFETLT